MEMGCKAGASMDPGVKWYLGEVDEMFIVFHSWKSKKEVEENSFVASYLTFDWKMEIKNEEKMKRKKIVYGVFGKKGTDG